MGHIRYVASTLLILTACGSASASVTWTCALSNDALNLVCAASADAAGMRVVNARPLAVVNGCEFPLNPTEIYTVPLYSQPTDIDFLYELARDAMCALSAGCKVQFAAPSLGYAMPERLRQYIITMR